MNLQNTWQIIYSGFFELYRVITSFGTFEILKTTNSVCLLVYLEDQKKILLIRQRRAAMITSENPDGLITEAVAGRFDVHLSAKALAAKEALEEAGAIISEDKIELLNNGAPLAVSAGAITEKSYLTFAKITSDQIESTERVFGVPAEGERISRLWLTVEEFSKYSCEDVRVFAFREWFFRNILPNYRKDAK